MVPEKGRSGVTDRLVSSDSKTGSNCCLRKGVVGLLEVIFLFAVTLTSAAGFAPCVHPGKPEEN